LLLNKIRRLMLARVKKIIKKKKIIKNFWFKLGHLTYIFKKGLNLRMGKGDGSLFSIRRIYHSGSFILIFKSIRYGYNNFIFRYIKSKLSTNVSVYCNFFKDTRYFSKKSKKVFKKLIYFFKKSKKFFLRFNYNFSNKGVMLWLLTYRFYRRYSKKNILFSKNFFFFKKYRKLYKKNFKKKYKYIFSSNKKFIFYFNFLFLKMTV
jgi:hypothetical protein